MNPAGQIVHWSREAYRAFGFVADEVTGTSAANLVEPELRPGFLEAIAAAASNAHIELLGSARAVGKNGVSFPVELSVTPWTFDERLVAVSIHDFSAIDDISSLEPFHSDDRPVEDLRRRIDELEAFVRHVTEAQELSHIGTFERNLITGTGHWSDEMFRIYGMDPREVSFEEAMSRIVPDERDALRTALELAVNSGRPLDARFRIRRDDGEVRLLRMRTLSVLDEGRPVRYIGTVFDLTDEELATRERRELQRELDQTKRLSSLGRIAATMAHEFNNVLMGIDTFAEVLRRRHSDETTQHAVTRIQQSIKRGKRVSDEMLRYTRASRPVFAPIDVKEWLSEFLHEASALTNGRVVLECEEGLTVAGDLSQLNQVLANLVLNARDASPEGGPITMRASRFMATVPPNVDGPHGCAQIVVSDCGSGIAAELCEHIFEPLFTTKRGGTGLGLAVVHQVVHAHHGDITVKSKVGQGTDFCILLPLMPETAASTVPAPRTVVLVEDEPAVALGLAELLRMEGVRTRTVSRGREALEEIARELPQAVLLDIMLPDVSGIDVYAEISRRWPHLPVIFISGHFDRQYLANHLVQPHVAFLRKPFNADALFSTLDRVAAAPS